MALTRLGVASLWLVLASAASAQTVIGEVSGTVGVSSDDVTAAATQARLFGNLHQVGFFTEGAWAASRTAGDGHESEAFTTAYPYAGSPHLLDAYVERRLGGERLFAVVRGGRFRTPFGIHDASDYAYNGFLRAPLVRYEGYWALSNMLFEHGVNVLAGTTRVQGEVTVGRPSDVSDDYHRRAGADVVLRAQAYAGPFVLGVTHLRSRTYELDYATGRLEFTGLDVRWMTGGVQARAEVLAGRVWNDTTTYGGYLDVSVHRPFMGPATVVTRLETLDYRSPNPIYSDVSSGLAVGTRIRLAPGLFGQVNVTHRPSAPYAPNATATDVAFTYTGRYFK